MEKPTFLPFLPTRVPTIPAPRLVWAGSTELLRYDWLVAQIYKQSACENELIADRGAGGWAVEIRAGKVITV